MRGRVGAGKGPLEPRWRERIEVSVLLTLWRSEIPARRLTQNFNVRKGVVSMVLANRPDRARF